VIPVMGLGWGTIDAAQLHAATTLARSTPIPGQLNPYVGRFKRRQPHTLSLKLPFIVEVSTMPDKKFYIEPFGCQMNFHDSENVAGTLQHEGYVQVESEHCRPHFDLCWIWRTNTRASPRTR
jgi:hypothetical protein